MRILMKSIKDGWLLLSEKGSRLRMILAGALLAFAVVTPMISGVYSSFLLEAFLERLPAPIGGGGLVPFIELPLSEETAELLITSAAYTVTALVGIIITLPAFSAFLTYCWRTYSRTRYGFVDSERKRGTGYGYFRCLWAGAIMLFRPMLCFIILQAGYLSARLISEIPIADGLFIPMIIPLVLFWSAGIAVSVLFLWLTNSKFYAPYYFARGFGVIEAGRKSKAVSAAYPFVCDAFSLLFGAMTLLSLLSVGVLFVLLVLPLMMFTYFSLAEHLDGKKLLED